MAETKKNFLRTAAAGGLAVAAIAGLPGLAHGARPNIIVIQTDDQSPRTADATYRGHSGKRHLVMPKTMNKIFHKGTEFRDHYATSPICSPSRASMLTGQYPQNDRLTGNSGAHGGWEGWQKSPGYRLNFPAALQKVGYRTAHIGKFMNGYYDSANDRVDTTIPHGWNNWFTTAYLPGTRYYGYPVSANGWATGLFGDPNYQTNGPGIDSKKCTADLLTKRFPGRKCNYLTDVMARRAVSQIRKNKRKGGPFYMQVDFQAPHGDIKAPAGPQPPTRYMDSASRTPLPRPKNFNEADFSDKPNLVRRANPRRLNRLEIKRLKKSYRKQLESLRGVDDGVGAIIKTLRRTRQLKNTYIVFTSDHGYYLGEHRYQSGKFMPYEESATVPMAIRGPGVPRGRKTREPTSNVDIASTAMKLAHAKPGYRLDGRTLRRVWRHPNRKTRRPVGVSLELKRHEFAAAASASGGASISSKAPVFNYKGYRVGPYKYVDYERGGDELYDLRRDPFELHNRIHAPRYSAVRRYMEFHLDAVNDCKGASCRAELPPWPKPHLSALARGCSNDSLSRLVLRLDELFLPHASKSQQRQCSALGGLELFLIDLLRPGYRNAAREDGTTPAE